METILMIALIMAVTELLITKIVEVMGCKASSYLVFAIVDIVVGLLILVLHSGILEILSASLQGSSDSFRL